MMKAHTFSATPTPADAVTPHGVDDRKNDQKRDADQKILQSDRSAEPDHLAEQRRFDADVVFVHFKR